jgi:glycosyltransferase involved in cell wall biosynthesis
VKKTIVVSAINLFEGGPRTILEDCLEHLSDNFSSQFRIIALVHDANLLKIPNIEYREFKSSRKHWLYRIYYEYVYFYFLSRRIRPYLWLSLHDITPNVVADIRAVYCQNPSPFYPFSFRLLLSSYQVALFSLFYRYLYRININKNAYVIVQQAWIRTAFQKMYDIKNVMVAYPSAPKIPAASVEQAGPTKVIFFYPAFPRVFKKIEVVAEAAKLLHDQGRTDFDVLLTIEGNENAYARHIVDKYKCIPVITFLGLRPKNEIYRLYQHVTALIFSSALETWGLPISEFKAFNKPMLLSNLPYAHETIGDYDKVKFFDPHDPQQLADYMKAFLDRTLNYDGNRRVDVPEPFAADWGKLFTILLSAKQMHNDAKQ